MKNGIKAKIVGKSMIRNSTPKLNKRKTREAIKYILQKTGGVSETNPTDISKLLVKQERNANEWIRIMWDMDVIEHKNWEDVDEVMASMQSYLRGNHKK